MQHAVAGCPRCKSAPPADDQFCTRCGAKLIACVAAAPVEHEIAPWRARQWIFWIGVWYVVGALLTLSVDGDHMSDHDQHALLSVNLGLLAIHAALSVWAKAHALPAALVALVLFVTLQVVAVLLHPTAMYSSPAIKIGFVIVLVKAIHASLDVHRRDRR